MCVYITHKYYTESEFNIDLCLSVEQFHFHKHVAQCKKQNKKHTLYTCIHTHKPSSPPVHTHTPIHKTHTHLHNPLPPTSTHTHRGKETGKTGHPEYHHRHLLSVLDSLAVTENKADASIYATVSQSVICTQCIQSLTAKLWDHHSRKIKYICNQHYKR